MPKFEVDIERVDIVQETFSVEADTSAEADRIAHEKAGDMEWRRSSDPDYNTTSIREVSTPTGADLVRELIDMMLPCNAQSPQLQSFEECPEEHPHCCGRCELIHRARKWVANQS